MNLDQPSRLEIVIKDLNTGKSLEISECFGVVNLERRDPSPVITDEIKPLYVLDYLKINIEAKVTGTAVVK